jgi:hypothetical protein
MIVKVYSKMNETFDNYIRILACGTIELGALSLSRYATGMAF